MSGSLKNANADVGPLVSPKKSENGKQHYRAEALGVLNFLNTKTGRAYRPTETNLGFIIQRIRDGATVDDCRGVIAKKTSEWLHDDRMRVYLRPATLFNRTKFDQYAGELGGTSGEWRDNPIFNGAL